MTCKIVTNANFSREVLEYLDPVVVVFEAEWSGACHIVAPIIEDLARVFEGQIQICRLDVEANNRMAHKYGIRALPTLLFFKRGQIVDSLTGIVSKQQLKTRLDSF